MSLNLFKELGYTHCGYLQRLSENKGSVGKELWYEFVISDIKLSTNPGPLVYLWFYKDEIIYVGETSKSVKERIINGHFGGFRGGSNSGVEKQKQLLHLDEDRIDIFIAFQPFFLKYLHEKVKSVDGNNFSKMFYPIHNDMMLAKYLEEKSIISMFNPKLNIK